ncbi:MAG: calcium/proton exchanger [Chloroflexi bacterium]|nr:calcium/proton exchanger [Chloroflexota bacterium]MBU1748950.1 calcium/proton exchanger [Chloroflexota bacterium]
MKYLSILLALIPVAVILQFVHADPIWIFVTGALALIPLAAWLGQATEELALYTGPRVGGFLNATLGNAAELIITIVAIREGLLELVKASITGSILGNLLLVLGLSVLLGGLRHGLQVYDRRGAGVNASMLTLAAIGLAIPAVFGHSIDQVNHDAVEWLSIGVAVILMFVYALSLIYAFTRREQDLEIEDAMIHEIASHKPSWSLPLVAAVLLGSTLLTVWMSEVMVGAVEPVVQTLGLTEFFLGVVIVPIVGNVAEHLVGVTAAWKNKMELSLAISVGSSMQVALFVAPLLVFVSLLMGNPMNLIFNPFELAALGAAIAIVSLISLDGESNWLEGAQLLGVYLIIALAFYFLPTSAMH